MNSINLKNLEKSGQIKTETFDKNEFLGLLKSGRASLQDATNQHISLESRFLLAYTAAHALSLAALRWHNYRSNNRFIVFQVLPFTIGASTDVWRVLAMCHNKRNLAEYEGHIDVDEQIVDDLLVATQKVLLGVEKLKI